MESLTFEQLLDWIDGRLPAAEAADVAAQVARAGDDVQAVVAWLRSFDAARRDLLLLAPPPAVRRVLDERFAAFAAARRPPAFWQRLTARLTYDSHAQPAPAGARHLAAAAARQLVYASEFGDIVLNVRQPTAEPLFDVAGQILSAGELDLADFVVQLQQDGLERGLTAADELGEFAFTAVSPGRYDLVISGSHAEAWIHAVELVPGA